MMREFLVEIVTTVPSGTTPALVERRYTEEAARISELAGRGSVLRLWHAGDRTLALLRAHDEADLHAAVLDTLPLRPWMRLAITALTAHPNDPLASRS
jgi:muconolactone D-isomerase